tara:strand:- start:453 stop:1130 length:678 start_codon:yes stop_codon:yes gene_type:complete
MSSDNFARAFSLVLVHEGGYVDHPSDPGGATNLGVTIGTLSDWLDRPASKADVRALTRATVAPIYRARYWDAVQGDELPPGIDFAIFDYAVNSGPARAIMGAQRYLGVADDGKLGPITLRALRNADPGDVIRGVCAERMAFLRRLSTWPVFGDGWTNRVDGVRQQALAMTADVIPGPGPYRQPDDPGPDIPDDPEPMPFAAPEPTPQPATKPAGSFLTWLWSWLR